MAIDNDDSLVGQLLADRYALSRLIGRGGMASVYQAWDTRLERFVAIKMFSPGTASNDGRRQSEVKLLARVNHPHLVTLHDAHLSAPGSGAPSYLVMELVEGPDLGARLLQGTVPLDEAATLVVELAEALVAIHDAGVVHRDLKPGNVLLSPTGLDSPLYRAKIGDFGIAHLVGAEPLTTVGTVIGTAAYLSPEQAMGQDASPASDIYSLGLLMLESVTGERAFTGTMMESISARLARDPLVPTTLPPAWIALLTAMTARHPEDRPTALSVVSAGRSLPIGTAATAAAVESGSAQTAPTEQMLAPTKVLPVQLEPAAESRTETMVASAITRTRAPRNRRGQVAAGLSLLAAVIIAVAVGASALSGSGSKGTTPSDPAPNHSATTTSQTSSTPTPRKTAVTTATPASTPTPTPTPTVTTPVTTPVPPGVGNGKGKGKDHKPPKPHKP